MKKDKSKIKKLTGNVINKIKNINVKTIKKRTWLIIGIVLIVLLCVGLPLINARRQASLTSQVQTAIVERGSLSATIGATGTVRANQTATLAWQTSGTVKTVNVQPGDKVKTGDVLATLLETSLPQNIIMAQADLVSALQALDNAKNSKAAQAQAQLDLINSKKAYDTAKANRDNILAQSRRASQETIDDAYANYVLAQQNADRAYSGWATVSDQPEDSVARASAYSAYYDALQARNRTWATMNWYSGKPTANDIAEMEAKFSVAQAQLEDAQRKWDRLENGPDPADVAAAQARVDAAQATINMGRLIAPFNGTVTIANPVSGDQASPGTVGFRIDDLSRLQVDVQVSEVDINSVKTGQPATMTFDAILNQEYHGKVVEVALAGDSVQGVVNFTVTVELTDADELVKPGMTAAVTIVTQQVTDALLVPNRTVRLVDGQRVVYVLRKGKTVQISVTLGAASDTMSEVVSGDLAEGDLILLNPPANIQPGGGGGGGFMVGG